MPATYGLTSGGATLTKPDHNTVTLFEQKIAEFFGAPYAVAVDSCTHGLELCLRYNKANFIDCPNRTYLSIPMLSDKLNIRLGWYKNGWHDFYCVWADFGYPDIFDAAVLWRANSYIPGSFMCISFQYQKHLSLGRGGMILCDNKEAAIQLKKDSYDGRLPGVPWRDQGDILTSGMHYYMTPETAQLGLDKLDDAIRKEPRKWSYLDYPNISEYTCFKQK